MRAPHPSWGHRIDPGVGRDSLRLNGVAANGNALGDYLRARRGQVRPEDVGLVQGARRRVQGLRREELATLAGISSDYYLRLEQGRDKNPSAQILDALARALQLDVKATDICISWPVRRAAAGITGVSRPPLTAARS